MQQSLYNLMLYTLMLTATSKPAVVSIFFEAYIRYTAVQVAIYFPESAQKLWNKVPDISKLA